MMRVDRVIALAGRLFQAGRIGNIDGIPAVADNSCQLQCMSDNRKSRCVARQSAVPGLPE